MLLLLKFNKHLTGAAGRILALALLWLSFAHFYSAGEELRAGARMPKPGADSIPSLHSISSHTHNRGTPAPLLWY